MQNDLEANHPGLAIRILGINSVGQETGVASFTSGGRDLPFLQDVDSNTDGASDTWASWGVKPRDVVILDGNNHQIGVYNLTEHDLENAADFATLKQMLITAATPAGSAPWQNSADHLDVNNDGSVTPVGDVLKSINELNQHLYSDPVSGKLQTPPAGGVPYYYDVNGDGYISAVADILPIVNFLNNPQAEGESTGRSGVNPDSASFSSGISEPLAATSIPVGDPSMQPCAESADKERESVQPAIALTTAPAIAPPVVPSVESESRSPAIADSTQAGPLEALVASLAEDLASVWYGQNCRTR
jgi:hypothetical protein